MTRKKLFYMMVLICGVFTACTKATLKQSTTEDVNIVGYLRQHPDSFSLFEKVLVRAGYSDYLNAYGAYTCFAPTNSAVQLWLNKVKASNVEAADINTLQDMVKFHLLADTLTTASFKDGKLPVPTMFGQFLVTGVASGERGSSYLVNRQGAVTKSNVRVGNGLIHVIDQVLEPAKLTIAEELAAKPDFSIFVEAMKATGYYDRLNTVDADTAKRWMTVIAESNKALADSGIFSFADLKARYSHTGNPAGATDSLHMYMAYHILSGIKFLGDIINAPSHQTLQPQEVISTQLINQEVVVNENVFNGVLEKGMTVDRVASDNAATNGVWHSIEGHYQVKYRKPTAVYWDVATFEEILKLPATYRKASKDFVRQSEADQPLKDITWGWGALAGTNVLSYYYGPTVSIGQYCNYQDAIKMPLGLPNRPTYLELRTPPIIKGKYKIWICYSARNQSTSSQQLCEVYVNGTLMPRTFNFVVKRPTGTNAELEAIGYKQYTENAASQMVGRLVGTYEFTTTDRQIIRFNPINGTQNDNYLDMIHFIPVDDDQVFPRFKPDGTQLFQ
ncbi:fasciclin domain-containing protein [Chitinophaga sp. sic0106]|uniref:fasciclin domain-containing protein n=1 Tax=Chitinophaga sp. sic0106 TaxID=2854785 RepID=UPI001C43E2D1|nr:fasciclin domain-containing protein [Chitinophaga sp. sic0106]MBV7529195.1 fasciclin domain-containing protein [Chitinophaga sp. sic0106]